MIKRSRQWWLIAFAAVIAIAWFLGGHWYHGRQAGAADECVVSYPPAPRSLSDTRIAPGRTDSGNPRIVEFRQRSRRYRVLIYHACRADYRVDFYRLRHGRFVRFGAESELLNFDPPRLDLSASPVLRATERDPPDPMHFEITDSDAEIVPDRGSWTPVAPGIESTPVTER